jgi:hypothetical protein
MNDWWQQYNNTLSEATALSNSTVPVYQSTTPNTGSNHHLPELAVGGGLAAFLTWLVRWFSKKGA